MPEFAHAFTLASSLATVVPQLHSPIDEHGLRVRPS
uniref:Uncharacterized protein n=1 Tax=Mycolicibacterium neoaurum VKM Ac-1815D TaxID=700508 RepID=V5XJP7_MYCNE